MTDTESRAAAESSPARDAGRAGGLGAILGLVGALPALGPALVATCLWCVGAGTAVGVGVGVGATAVLPGRWWVAGAILAGVGALAVVAIERRRARRCARRLAVLRTVAALVAGAAVAYLASVLVVAPLLTHLVSGGAPGGPTLP